MKTTETNSKKASPIGKLYNYFPRVQKLILQYGGSKDDAKDTFQAGLIIYCRKMDEPGFTFSSAPETFLFGICRLLWMDELKKRKRGPWFDKLTMTVEDSALGVKNQHEISEIVEEEKKYDLAEKAIASLGEKCKEILRLFYFEKRSMTDIAKKLGFKSEKIAKNQKYKCIETARKNLGV